MRRPGIVASVLGADYARLGQEAAELGTAGVDRIQMGHHGRPRRTVRGRAAGGRAAPRHHDGKTGSDGNPNKAW